jgi:NAD(P)-dependent dehydrogenase (short-subunit alcohol dehydrogenase family)
LHGRVALSLARSRRRGNRPGAARQARCFIATFAALTAAEETHDGGEYARQRAQNADAAVEAIRALGVKADSAEVDLSDSTAIPALYDRVEAALAVEILVNNAAAWQADRLSPRKSAPLRPGPHQIL